MSEQTKIKISKANTGNKWNAEARKRRSEKYKKQNNPFFGKHFSQKSKELLSKSLIKANGVKIRCIETGKIYNCIGDANEALGKPRKSYGIYDYFRGRSKTGYGYHWEKI